MVDTCFTFSWILLDLLLFKGLGKDDFLAHKNLYSTCCKISNMCLISPSLHSFYLIFIYWYVCPWGFSLSLFNPFDQLISGRGGYDYKAVRRWTSQRKLGYGLIECDKVKLFLLSFFLSFLYFLRCFYYLLMVKNWEVIFLNFADVLRYLSLSTKIYIGA